MGTPRSDREARYRALNADAYGAVLRFGQRRVERCHAEDVTADAFLVAWRRFDDAPRRPEDLRAWLFGIARNCLLNTLRGQGRRDALAVRIGDVLPAAGVAEAVDADLVAQRIDLAAAWQRLSATPAWWPGTAVETGDPNTNGKEVGSSSSPTTSP